jgi:acyl-CoA thioester hydrolase
MQTHELGKYPLKTHDKVRYADTDRQGHVNNSVFSQFLETGRVEVLYSTDQPVLADNASFVIASLSLNFLDEIHWPGTVDIGTRVARIGASSLTLQQSVFQDTRCVATAKTVIVQVDNQSRRSKPLSQSAQENLRRWYAEEESGVRAA